KENACINSAIVIFIRIISTSRKRVIGGLYRQICATPPLAGGARGERMLRSTRGFRDLLILENIAQESKIPI
ncbi:MAG: hypothetical protein Q8L87_00960, partial [Anaerolineales bacterium]|nr:hypothetical protein [Anaerolineales bacterium]